MLQELGIEDDYLNASKTFVRAELIPANNEWWEDPDGWNFIVDQDVVPEWFENDRDKYIVEFKAAVKAWWTEHVLVDKKIDELTGGYYLLKRCEVKKLLNDVRIAIMGNSKVGEMWENSNVGTMWGNSKVGTMWESSKVGTMWGNSKVGTMWENSKVGEMWGNSNVGTMWGNSKVGTMWESSKVGEMRGNSKVGTMRGNSKVGEMWENSNVGTMWENSIARHYGKGKIFISPECNLAVAVFENPKEDKNA